MVQTLITIAVLLTSIVNLIQTHQIAELREQVEIMQNDGDN